MQIPTRRFFNLLSVYEILLDDNRLPILCLRPWNTKTFCSRLQQHCQNDMLHIPIQPQWRYRSADKCISLSFSHFPEETLLFLQKEAKEKLWSQPLMKERLKRYMNTFNSSYLFSKLPSRQGTHYNKKGKLLPHTIPRTPKFQNVKLMYSVFLLMAYIIFMQCR